MSTLAVYISLNFLTDFHHSQNGFNWHLLQVANKKENKSKFIYVYFVGAVFLYNFFFFVFNVCMFASYQLQLVDRVYSRASLMSR